MKKDAQGPKVHKFAVVALVSEKFRSGVGRTAAKCVQCVARIDGDAETEIAQFDQVGTGEKDVFSFDIAMDDADFMLKIRKIKFLILKIHFF